MAVNDLILVLVGGAFVLEFKQMALTHKGADLPTISTCGCFDNSCDLLINIGLTILGVIPGHIHGFYLIYKKSKAEEQYGIGNVQYLGNGEYRPSGNLVQQPGGYGSIN